MFTTIDKALVAAVLAILSIVNLLWGVDLFGPHTEEVVGTVIAVAIPIFVWFFPNRSPSDFGRGIAR